MRQPTFLVLISAVFTASVTAQIPTAQGHSTVSAPTTAGVQPLATNEIPPVEGLSTSSPTVLVPTTSSLSSGVSSASSASTASTASASVTSAAAVTSVNSASIDSNSIPFGSTLSNGGYVCNPAHFYASTLSCDDSNPTPTLVTISAGSTTAVAISSTTAANGSVIAYTGYTPTGTAWISTWTGAAAVNVIPLAGALIAGAVAFAV